MSHSCVSSSQLSATEPESIFNRSWVFMKNKKKIYQREEPFKVFSAFPTLSSQSFFCFVFANAHSVTTHQLSLLDSFDALHETTVNTYWCDMTTY